MAELQETLKAIVAFFNSRPDSQADDEWHHCAATYDGSTILIYLDGLQQGASRWRKHW